MLKGAEKGFSLIECLIAMVVTMVGLLAVFQLVSISVQMETFSYRSIEANNLATNKVEQLKLGTLTNGGGLTSNISGYSDTTNQNYVVRWQVSDGAVGSKDIIVEVIPKNSDIKYAKVRLETLVR